MRVARTWTLYLCFVLVFAGAPGMASAQDRTTSAETPKKKRGKVSKSRAGGKAAKADPAAPPTAASDAPVPTQAEAAATTPSAEPEGDVRKEGGSEVKVLEFSGLDIEGQLKTPQMLYFLRRLRAEFGRPNLPHRSFLPELEQTTKDEEF